MFQKQHVYDLMEIYQKKKNTDRISKEVSNRKRRGECQVTEQASGEILGTFAWRLQDF